MVPFCNSLLALLTKNSSGDSPLHASISSWASFTKGILKILFASSLEKVFLTSSTFHFVECISIRSETTNISSLLMLLFTL